MKIEKNETKIIRHWKFENSKMIADKECERIQWLINNSLLKVAIDSSGWDVLYKDESDNRYWELIYPNSELQGGGPPSLILLSELQAKEKYII
jgi:hypothetical protein